MPFVRKKRGQVLVVHSRRDPGGRVVQQVLHRFESALDLHAALEDWRTWSEMLAWAHSEVRFDFAALRTRLGDELRQWWAAPDGASERRRGRVLRLVSELGSHLAGLSLATPADAELVDAARPQLAALHEELTRLIGEGRHTRRDHMYGGDDPARKDEPMLPTSVMSEAESRSKMLFEDGMEAWWRGDRVRAVAQWRAALRKWPGHVDAMQHLGLAAFERGRLAEAARHFQAALELGQHTLEFDEEAPERARWCVLENRPYLRALANLGLTRARQKRHAEALVIYERLVELNPDDNQGIRYLIGEQHHRAGRLDDALAAYREAREGVWTEPGVAFGLALALHQKGQRDAATRAVIDAFAANRYVAPMLLGLPWERAQGYHGTSFAEPEHALGYVQGAGELWRKDRAAGRLLSVWWQAPAVRAWLVELAQCMVALDASASPEAHMRAQERRRRLLGDAHLAAIHSAAALEVTERA